MKDEDAAAEGGRGGLCVLAALAAASRARFKIQDASERLGHVTNGRGHGLCGQAALWVLQIQFLTKLCNFTLYKKASLRTKSRYFNAKFIAVFPRLRSDDGERASFLIK